MCIFCLWARSTKQQKVSQLKLCKFQRLLRVCIKNVICKMHFWYFLCSDALYFHIFAKMCSPLGPGAHFWKTTLSNQPSKIHFLEPWMPWMKDQWAIFLPFIVFLPVRFVIFRLQTPIKILFFVWKNVYFLFMSRPGNLRLALIVLSNVF